MEPFGNEGTPFIISFTPKEYGKTIKGKLIIQTEDMYWSYIVKGILPKYIPPVALNATFETHLEQKSTLP